MANVPQSVLASDLSLTSLKKRSRGKVRACWDLPDHKDKMLVVASDGCSIFDFVLNVLIPNKGYVLAALNHFWVQYLKSIFKTDLLTCGATVDEFLPKNHRDWPELQKRASVVTICAEPEVEDVCRQILAGTGWKSYRQDGTVCGHRLPPNLVEGSRLPFWIYTPTTKAKVGHDVHLKVDDVINKYGHRRERLALQVMSMMAEYAERRGILLGDGKLEMADDVVIDEKGTPDSCRFMDLRTYRRMITSGKLAPFLDKQYVRDWGIKVGINKLDPKKPEDVEQVHKLSVPEDVIRMTTRIYRYIFWRLTGQMIEAYQSDVMGIEAKMPRRRIEILVGSEGDWPQVEQGIKWLRSRDADFAASIVSCHRNASDLDQMAKDGRLAKADVIVAGAGSAAALPGDIKRRLCDLGHPEKPVIGVAFENKDTRHTVAAQLSIECLPGQPVELDPDERAYTGPAGFLAACHAAVNNEFLPKRYEKKDAKLDYATNLPA